MVIHCIIFFQVSFYSTEQVLTLRERHVSRRFSCHVPNMAFTITTSWLQTSTCLSLLFFFLLNISRLPLSTSTQATAHSDTGVWSPSAWPLLSLIISQIFRTVTLEKSADAEHTETCTRKNISSDSPPLALKTAKSRLRAVDCPALERFTGLNSHKTPVGSTVLQCHNVYVQSSSSCISWLFKSFSQQPASVKSCFLLFFVFWKVYKDWILHTEPLLAI